MSNTNETLFSLYGTEKDPLFEKILKYAKSVGKISAPTIVNEYKVPFNRAQQLIKTYEDLGYIEKFESGSHIREHKILIVESESVENIVEDVLIENSTSIENDGSNNDLENATIIEEKEVQEEKIRMNLPNKLTLIRIAMIPIFAIFFFITAIPYNYLISAIIFVLAAATDFLDGYIARKYNLVTNLGKFLDPIADKVLVSTALIIMLTNSLILPWYASIAVAIILMRELIISGFRMIAASRGLVLSADMVGKVKTVFQDVAVVVLLVGVSFSASAYSVMNVIGLVLLLIATILTLVSGILYLVKNKHVLKG